MKIEVTENTNNKSYFCFFGCIFYKYSFFLNEFKFLQEKLPIFFFR